MIVCSHQMPPLRNPWLVQSGRNLILLSLSMAPRHTNPSIQAPPSPLVPPIQSLRLLRVSHCNIRTKSPRRRFPELVVVFPRACHLWWSPQCAVLPPVEFFWREHMVLELVSFHRRPRWPCVGPSTVNGELDWSFLRRNKSFPRPNSFLLFQLPGDCRPSLSRRCRLLVQL